MWVYVLSLYQESGYTLLLLLFYNLYPCSYYTTNYLFVKPSFAFLGKIASFIANLGFFKRIEFVCSHHKIFSYLGSIPLPLRNIDDPLTFKSFILLIITSCHVALLLGQFIISSFTTLGCLPSSTWVCQRFLH